MKFSIKLDKLKDIVIDYESIHNEKMMDLLYFLKEMYNFIDKEEVFRNLKCNFVFYSN